MTQLLDKQEISTITLRKKYHSELLLLCPLPLHEAVLKNSPWLVVQRGVIDMVGGQRVGACAGCALARTQLGRRQGGLPWLLWEFMLGQKSCPPPSLWYACPSGLLWAAIAVLETG